MTLDENRKTRKLNPPVEEVLDRLAIERHHDTPSVEGDVQKMDEKDQYTYHYDRIYPLLKEGRLDYTQIADKTEFKERRIRETLLFRLSTGEVMQLFGRKEGYCYICKKRLTAAKTTEPLCLKCLQAIDTAAQECHMSSLLSIDSGSRHIIPDDKLTNSKSPKADAPLYLQPTEHQALTEPFTSDQAPISREQYDALLAELNHYKAQAQKEYTDEGPINTLVLQEAKEAPVNSPLGKKTDEKSPLAIASTDLLAILEMNDEELSTENYWEPETVINHSQPLRQFGFQRLKSTGTERGNKW